MDFAIEEAQIELFRTNLYDIVCIQKMKYYHTVLCSVGKNFYKLSNLRLSYFTSVGFTYENSERVIIKSRIYLRKSKTKIMLEILLIKYVFFFCRHLSE